jgi:hypothetical protein
MNEEGQEIPCIKPENIRHLLGEMLVLGQKIGSSDDVTATEEWNKIPLDVRAWMLSRALDSLPKIIEDTEKQSADRVKRIERVLFELRSLTSLEGQKIAEEQPFADPQLSLPLN